MIEPPPLGVEVSPADLAKAISDFRKRNGGMSQYRFAKLFDVTVEEQAQGSRAVRRWESGRQPFRYPRMLLWAMRGYELDLAAKN